ncbi:C4b-binding protein alpha chain isoform X2 [Nelusetta ayraudi]|uniref:C4b-binding protein alpha chain isoform X2 n=1 Tax=Nelusetta ayraudi TaxID=303726 RepID=UPI003F70BAD4
MGVVADTCGRRGARLLLLLEFLLFRVSADCERPETPHDMKLTEKTLLMSSFPEGVSVALVCYDGYHKTSGTGLVTCTAGNWTQPDLFCARKDCGAPPAQPNMIFDLSGGTELGDTIKVTCEEGYQISGSSYKQCFANGWLGRSKCKVKDCRSPKLRANMTVSVANGTLYGAEIEVFCNKGFGLNGSRIRRCETRGWSGDPHCEPVSCDAVHVLAFGRSSWDSNLGSPTVGQTINFACDEGRVLTGASAIVCQENGTYDNQPPLCLSDGTTASTKDNDVTSTVFFTTPVPKVTTRNAFIRRQGELNEQQSSRTSPLGVLLSCLALSFRTHRDHSGPGVSHVGCLFSVFCHTERFFKKNRVRTCHCFTACLLFALLLQLSFFPLPPFALLPAPFICALVTSSSCAIEQMKLRPCNDNKENTPLHTNIDPALLFSDWTG